MNAAIVLRLAYREFRESLRARGLILLALVVGGAGSALASFGHNLAQVGAVQGFGPTAASLVNLIMLSVPLVGLVVGAQAVAGERERRSLAYILAQPVSRGEFLLGKFGGMMGALLVALALAFGWLGLVLHRAGEPLPDGVFLAFVALTAGLGAAVFAVGLAISVAVTHPGAALGAAVLAWAALVFLTDLALLAGAVVLHLGPPALLAATFLNPVQAYKVAAVALLQPALDVLGPVGMYAADTLGPRLLPLLVADLLLWTAAPLVVAVWLFRRRDVPV